MYVGVLLADVVGGLYFELELQIMSRKPPHSSDGNENIYSSPGSAIHPVDIVREIPTNTCRFGDDTFRVVEVPEILTHVGQVTTSGHQSAILGPGCTIAAGFQAWMCM